MTATTTPFNRVRVINDMYHTGSAQAADILRADFAGRWPLAELVINNPPALTVNFNTHSTLFSDAAAHVNNSERAFTIHLNRLASLSTIFCHASKVRADSISHENIHILQKNMIQQGLSDLFGRFLRHGVKTMLKEGVSKEGRYYCAEDEIQTRLHMLVSAHYRAHHKIPLNQHELWSLLHHEGVKLHSRCVESLYQSPIGLKALGKFFREKRPWFVSSPVSDLNNAIANINPSQRDKFCRITLPALYGSLLELYGDQEGSRRMGYAHNITLMDMFFRQAWRLGYQLDSKLEHQTEKTIGKACALIAVMPETQKQDLARIIRHGHYSHPLSGKTLSIPPASAALLAPHLPEPRQDTDMVKNFQYGGLPADFALE